MSKLLDSFGQILTPDKNNKNNLGYYNHSIYFDTQITFLPRKTGGFAATIEA